MVSVESSVDTCVVGITTVVEVGTVTILVTVDKTFVN